VRRRALGAFLALVIATFGLPADAVGIPPQGCAPSPTFVDIPRFAARVRLDDARAMPDGSLLAVGVRTTSRGSTLVSLHGGPGGWTWTTTRIPALIGSVSGGSSDDAWALAFRVPFDAVAHWNGSTWTVIDGPPRPRGLGQNDQFDLVDIASVGDVVWVVGWVSRFQRPGHSVTRPYAAVWNGSSWIRTPVPRPATNRVELLSVSGSAADDVWTVGLTGPGVEPLVEHWDGDAWSIVTVAELQPGAFGYLNSVDAASPSLAWAIGPFRRGAFSWDGEAWARHRGAGYGISIAGPDDVWNGGAGYWYASHWDGGDWTEIALPHRVRFNEEMFDVEAARGGDQTFFVGSGRQFHRSIPLVARICPWDVTDTGLVDPKVRVRADAPSVLWRFVSSNTSPSRLVDLSELSLFDTGAREPGSTFLYQYPGAGSYPFRVLPAGTAAVVNVPVGLRYFPGRGEILLLLAPSAGVRLGLECEVQVRVPGSAVFETIDEASCLGGDYPVARPGTYSFRGRSFDPVTGASSGWSPTTSVAVAP
jgi:hypothetical protein